MPPPLKPYFLSLLWLFFSLFSTAEFCGQAWGDFASKLQKEYGQNKSRESELTFLFSGLTKWLEKKSLIYWHFKTFEEYIREDLNPLGLRIQIFPSFENLNSTFKTSWESNLKLCSTKMMSLLIDEYQKRLIEIDINVDKIYLQIQSLQTHSSFQELNEKLKTHFELFNKSILSKKENKFLRDKQAFQEGPAYKWHQGTSGGGFRNGPIQHPGQSDMSDTSSMSSFVSHPSSKQPRRTRHQKRHCDVTISQQILCRNALLRIIHALPLEALEVIQYQHLV